MNAESIFLPSITEYSQKTAYLCSDCARDHRPNWRSTVCHHWHCAGATKGLLIPDLGRTVDPHPDADWVLRISMLAFHRPKKGLAMCTRSHISCLHL